MEQKERFPEKDNTTELKMVDLKLYFTRNYNLFEEFGNLFPDFFPSPRNKPSLTPRFRKLSQIKLLQQTQYYYCSIQFYLNINMQETREVLEFDKLAESFATVYEYVENPMFLYTIISSCLTTPTMCYST